MTTMGMFRSVHKTQDVVSVVTQIVMSCHVVKCFHQKRSKSGAL